MKTTGDGTRRGFSMCLLLLLVGGLTMAADRPTREVTEQNITVRLDLGAQVIAVSVPQDRRFGGWGEAAAAVEAPVLATLPPNARSGFVSASVLAVKAKQFDDGLYAAVELAAEQGAGRFGGKAALLSKLARALAGQAPSEPLAVLYGAMVLGGFGAEVPSAHKAAAEKRARFFL